MAEAFTDLIRNDLAAPFQDDVDAIERNLTEVPVDVQVVYYATRGGKRKRVPIRELSIGECLGASRHIEKHALRLVQRARQQVFQVFLEQGKTDRFFSDLNPRKEPDDEGT
ncbi:hypothetical protein [Elongatibacter sediminis]|uniref:Uncharacterized protein n=1 Tax=Elongatibacter sediminis TaxID=3119006 RepID=A0AAW9RJM6_9GAMM